MALEPTLGGFRFAERQAIANLTSCHEHDKNLHPLDSISLNTASTYKQLSYTFLVTMSMFSETRLTVDEKILEKKLSRKFTQRESNPGPLDEK